MEAHAIVAGLAGLAASFLSGLLGIGGGLVMAPLLLYVPGALGLDPLPVRLVAGLTIVQAFSASVFGVIGHTRRGYVSRRLVLLMGPPSAAGAFFGALVSSVTPDRTLLMLFALLALASAGVLLLPLPAPSGHDQPVGRRALGAVVISLVTGFAGGMVGLGGVLFTIAVVYLLSYPPRVAIGSSMGVALFAGTAGLLGKAATAQLDLGLAAVVFLAALLGSPLGAALSVRTRPRRLLYTLAAVVAFVALRIIWTAVTGS